MRAPRSSSLRRAQVLGTALVLAACSDPAAPVDRPDATVTDGGPLFDTGLPVQDGSTPIDATPDASAEAGSTEDTSLVEASLEAPREIRGAWIPSVYNLVFPSDSRRTEAQARAEIATILDTMASLRMNAAFVQVRPESDALYRSSIEPWSRFLTGTQGTDPGWDPLEVWITEAHARNIEVHAWVNPYRGMTSTSAARASNHVTRTLSEHTRTYGSLLVMDPGAPAVRAHVVRVVRDIVSRYAVDGIHFDDYFYPYPNDARDPFPDDATWNAYRAGGGTITNRGDWRRQNVHDLVRDVAQAIAEERDDVRFGISPFGIYRPGLPSGIVGLDAYAEIYCDPLPWLENGWVDYLAPQLYWRTEAQSFDRLLEWWGTHARDGRTILAGMNHSGLTASTPWTVADLERQIDTVQAQLGDRISGSIAYHFGPLLTNRSGVRDSFATRWPEDALTPPLASADRSLRPSAPQLAQRDGTLSVDHPDRASLRAFAIYEHGDSDWTFVRAVPATTTSLPAPAGREMAVTAIDRRGVESQGRRAP